MALMSCVGTKAHDALMQALEEAVKENSLTRLSRVLQDARIGSEEINRRNLLHQAAWLGYPTCVKLLLEQGADPDLRHRKNGCTPLHLAHFCTIEDTNAEETIRALLSAGARVNDCGGPKCGRYPIYHAIQHQRVDSVQVLLEMGSRVTLDAALIAIDVSNPRILEMLLMSGAECSRSMEEALYWGPALHRVLHTPLKCPKECYRQLLRLVVEATVCRPISGLARGHHHHHLAIERDLRNLAKDSAELTRYLYVYLVRNGLRPPEALRAYGRTLDEPDWMDAYLTSPVPLGDLCVRVLRSRLLLSGNIKYGVRKLKLPGYIESHVLFANPF